MLVIKTLSGFQLKVRVIISTPSVENNILGYSKQGCNWTAIGNWMNFLLAELQSHPLNHINQHAIEHDSFRVD